ncbi:MAG: glutathione S-transferase family protein [Gemmobacter sp.]
MTFYTNPMSRGRIARWMLEEVGQPYDTVLLDYGAAMKAPDYRAVNPMGKVPALVHGGQTITEVAAICTYLADAYPQTGLMPTDRAAFYRWMFFGAGPVEQAVVNTSFGWKPQTPHEKGRAGYGSLERVVQTLTDHLARSAYFCGDAFSAVDVYLGSQIGWGLKFGTMPANDTLRAYWDRLASRPALAAANARDDALMQKGE